MSAEFKFKVGDVLVPAASGRYAGVGIAYLVVKKYENGGVQHYYDLLEGDEGVSCWEQIHAEFNLEKLRT